MSEVPEEFNLNHNRFKGFCFFSTFVYLYFGTLVYMYYDAKAKQIDTQDGLYLFVVWKWREVREVCCKCNGMALCALRENLFVLFWESWCCLGARKGNERIEKDNEGGILTTITEIEA